MRIAPPSRLFDLGYETDGICWHYPCYRFGINLAHHLDAASRLSPKSAAIASRLLLKVQALLLPDAVHALRAALQAQSTESEEMSSSDLMVLATHDSPSQRLAKNFVFETTNHRMARQWVNDVMAHHELRARP